MSEHRGSYWKTALGAGSLSLTGVVVFWLMIHELIINGLWSSYFIPIWCGMGIVALCAETLPILVLSGALISLRRDRLEAMGMPYLGPPRERDSGIGAQCSRAVFRSLQRLKGRQSGRLDLCAGEWVEIRSLKEILATLDSHGELEGLPFMPEMNVWCGQQARVFRRVDKIFDWITLSGLRRMRKTVILHGFRCDGRDHGGCQADCQILWKEAWLRRLSTEQKMPVIASTESSDRQDLLQFTNQVDPNTGEKIWACQLSRLPQASTPTRWNAPRNLCRELLTGNIRLGPFWVFASLHLFNSVQRRLGRAGFPFLSNSQMRVTPCAALDLQPGELVQIKSKQEIEVTLNSEYKNRGLWFDKEMTRFCGGAYRVRARVTRQIDERTGKMIVFTTPCITLESVTSTCEYLEFAPLDERIYWREIWLERVKGEVHSDQVISSSAFASHFSFKN